MSSYIRRDSVCKALLFDGTTENSFEILKEISIYTLQIPHLNEIKKTISFKISGVNQEIYENTWFVFHPNGGWGTFKPDKFNELYKVVE